MRDIAPRNDQDRVCAPSVHFADSFFHEWARMRQLAQGLDATLADTHWATDAVSP
jgi:hypothetical protein